MEDLDDPMEILRKREEQGRAYRFRAERFEEDLKWMMRSPSGRRLAYWLLEESGVFKTTFKESQQRAQYMALAMAHDEGRKQFGYKFFAKLQTLCPELYAKMMKESRDAGN